MSHDLIAVFPRTADFDREAWNRALVEHELDVQLHEEFEVEDLNGVFSFTYKGKIVAPETFFRRNDRRGKSCIAMCCTGKDEIEGALVALAGLLTITGGKLEIPPKQDEDPMITAAVALEQAKALMVDKSKVTRGAKRAQLRASKRSGAPRTE